MSRPLKKILVPVDFSVGSHAAVGLATMMARAFGASVDVFHIWQPPPLVSAPVMVNMPQGQLALEDVARETATAQLKDIVETLRKAGVHEVRSRVSVGNPAHEILEYGACGFDLIVMGTHGRTGFAHALLGSVAEKVVRRASCPVLTVRAAE